IISPAPEQEAEHPECEQRPQQNGSGPCTHTLLYRNGEYCHEADCHRQPVPEQRFILWVPVIVSRAEASEKNTYKKDEGCSVATELPQPDGPDHDKRKI